MSFVNNFLSTASRRCGNTYVYMKANVIDESDTTYKLQMANGDFLKRSETTDIFSKLEQFPLYYRVLETCRDTGLTLCNNTSLTQICKQEYPDGYTIKDIFETYYALYFVYETQTHDRDDQLKLYKKCMSKIYEQLNSLPDNTSDNYVNKVVETQQRTGMVPYITENIELIQRILTALKPYYKFLDDDLIGSYPLQIYNSVFREPYDYIQYRLFTETVRNKLISDLKQRKINNINDMIELYLEKCSD